MIALIAGFGVAAAQQAPQPPANAAQESSGNASSSQTGAVNKPQTAPEQGEPQSTTGRGQTDAGLPAPPPSGPVFVNGVLNAPGAPQDTQTTPSKVSERNAALDKLPTMAVPLGLSDEQKQRIIASVSGEKPADTKVRAKPADILPSNIVLRDLPKDITSAIPQVADLKYVKLQDRVVLVRAPNRIVVAEIGK
jgi:hypothetical protein